MWSRPCGEWLAIYWEKNYTWLLPSWYWSDGTEVTLDGERDTQEVLWFPPAYACPAKDTEVSRAYGGNRKVLGSGEEATGGKGL